MNFPWIKLNICDVILKEVKKFQGFRSFITIMLKILMFFWVD